MLKHIRANAWLLSLTLIICSGTYPLTLWAIGRVPFFRDKTQGSLIVASDGKVIGSRLIAQPFTADEYFQPRPSAASYNGMASSGSNWSANNYLLRDRVARALGPIVRYGKGAEKYGKKPGDGVQADIESWFVKDQYQNQPAIVTEPRKSTCRRSKVRSQSTMVSHWLRRWMKVQWRVSLSNYSFAYSYGQCPSILAKRPFRKGLSGWSRI